MRQGILRVKISICEYVIVTSIGKFFSDKETTLSDARQKLLKKKTRIRHYRFVFLSFFFLQRLESVLIVTLASCILNNFRVHTVKFIIFSTVQICICGYKKRNPSLHSLKSPVSNKDHYFRLIGCGPLIFIYGIKLIKKSALKEWVEMR